MLTRPLKMKCCVLHALFGQLCSHMDCFNAATRKHKKEVKCQRERAAALGQTQHASAVATINISQYPKGVTRLHKITVRLEEELVTMEADLESDNKAHAAEEDYERGKRAQKMQRRIRKEIAKDKATMQAEVAEQEMELQVLHGDHYEPSFANRARQILEQKANTLLAKLQNEDAQTVEERRARWADVLMQWNKAIKEKRWQVTEVKRRFDEMLLEHSVTMQTPISTAGHAPQQNASMHGANVVPPAPRPRFDSMDIEVASA